MNTTALNGDVGDEQEHVDRQFNPATSSLTNSQAREMALETKICSDGRPCGLWIPCGECPNVGVSTEQHVVITTVTPAMVAAAEDAYMPFGDMEAALNSAIAVAREASE